MKNEAEHFELLKKEIAQRMNERFSMSSAEMSDWKGQDIVYLQEELEEKVKGRISSKWFYTHIKSSSDSLPRIDVLNMLSEFAGYQNWQQFVNSKSVPKKSKPNYKYLKAGLLFLPFLWIMGTIMFSDRNKMYSISFIDFDTNQPPNDPIQLQLIGNSESPILYTSDSAGVVKIPVNSKVNQLVIQSPYYRADTIVRKISTVGGEIFKIKTDDYALMVHYFSNSKVDDWKKRRAQLQEIFSDNAKIIEVIGNNIGVEYYTKEEFINKLTLPVSSLKNLEIIHSERAGGKIIEMRVKQKI